MKTSHTMGIVLVITAVTAFAAQVFSPVVAAIGPYEFVEGDSVVIDGVFSTSQAIEIGDRVLVRGRYTLASQAQAKLGLSLARTQSRGAIPILPGANREVSRGSGDFELLYEVTQVGCLRVGFSNLKDGKSFGTVFFATPEQLARVQRTPRRWIK